MQTASSSSRLAILSIVAMLAAACGGSDSGPMAPSALPGVGGTPAPVAGASITGTVTGTSAGSGIRALDGPMTVSVVGTSVASPVDDRGRFDLKGVPEGLVELRFTSGTDDARLGLGEVRRDDSIEVTVSVSGGSAVLISMSRDSSAEIELKGPISAIDGGRRSIVVLGRTVLVTETTEISESLARRTFDHLSLGQTVEIKGTPQGDVVVAASIEIEDRGGAAQPAPPGDAGVEVELRGNVADVGGSCPALQFSVAGTRVQTTGATSFERLACGEIATGLFVEVEGPRGGNGVVTARTVKREDAPGAIEPEVEFLGLLSAMAGASPNLTLTVGGRTVRTTAATVVRRSGNEVGHGALAIGQLLQVKGLASSDGAVDASRLTIEDEAADAEVEFEGRLTSMTGAAPNLTLVVGDRQVTTSAETVVRRSGDAVGFGALVVGQRLQVKGRPQGSAVAATRLTIED